MPQRGNIDLIDSNVSCQTAVHLGLSQEAAPELRMRICLDIHNKNAYRLREITYA